MNNLMGFLGEVAAHPAGLSTLVLSGLAFLAAAVALGTSWSRRGELSASLLAETR